MRKVGIYNFFPTRAHTPYLPQECQTLLSARTWSFGEVGFLSAFSLFKESITPSHWLKLKEPLKKEGALPLPPSMNKFI